MEESEPTSVDQGAGADIAEANGARQASSSDVELVKRLLGGDEGAFTDIVSQYHGPLLRLAQIFVSESATAEEVVQDTWMGVLKGLSRFQGRSSLKTWIFRILTNRAKTRGVREKRSVPFSALGDEDKGAEPAVDPDRFRHNGTWARPPRAWEDGTPEKLVLEDEAMGVLDAAIAELPPTQRAVVVLRDVEGLDADETCNVLDISGTNQRVLLHRARSKLRRVLEHYLDAE